MILSTGDRLDRYEVVAFLGSGGMGEVYRARDPKLERDVALKVLRLDRTVDPGGAERLLREARVIASLSHAHVLAVYDVGDVHEPERLRGLVYIAMEYVVGSSLRAYLGHDGVPLAKRIGWLRDVASALGAAHRAGIIHRDVKPENVMVRAEDGAVKVLDFGIARRASAPLAVGSSTGGHSLPTVDDPAMIHATLTGQGVIVGTPFYMAPEQLRGEPLDARADQFAWGVVAYRLLTGKSPWVGNNESVAVLSQILSADPPAPCVVDPRVSLPVSNVIMRALEKGRGARFGSMADAIEALDAAARGVDVSATVASHAALGLAVTEPVAAVAPEKLAHRTSRPWRSVVVAIGALSVLFAGFAWRGRIQRDAPMATASTAPSDPAACTTNAECTAAHGGAAWHCNARRHTCVEIAFPGCEVHAEPGDAEASDVVWIGGLFPFDPQSELVSEMNGADLARREFAQALGPYAARKDGLHARPIAFVACDEGRDPERALRHLVEDVEVPAVLGFRSSATALSAIPTELLPNHVLSFVSISQAPAVTKIPQPPGEPRLVWRSTLDRDECVKPLAAFVAGVLEPHARAAGLGTRPFKVAAVWGKSANHDMVEALFAALHFNGKSAVDNGSSFRQLVLEGDDAQDRALVDDLLAFAPNVVFFAGKAFVAKVLRPLEAGWRGTQRPTYLTEDGLSDANAAFVGANAARRRRFFAASNVSTTMTNAELVLRYNMTYPREPVVRTEAPQPSYDAFYMLAYAACALDGAVTGPALSKAFDRLLPTESARRRVDVGPAAIYETFGALRAGEGVDLNGAIGSLDFDRATGEAPIDYSIVCFGKDDKGVAFSSMDSGLVYDQRSKKLIGVSQCP